MRENKALTVAAALVSAGVWVGVYFALHNGGSPSLDSRPHKALGSMLAHQAAGLLKGGKITVIARDTAAFENPASDVQLAAFKKELRKSGLEIGALHLLQVDPLRPMEVPPGDFVRLIRESSSGSVIVSFVGPPYFTEAQWSAVAPVKPAIIAVCCGDTPARVDLKSLFQQGLLQVAILDRPKAGVTGKSGPGKNSFDDCFVVATPADTANLSSGTEPER